MYIVLLPPALLHRLNNAIGDPFSFQLLLSPRVRDPRLELAVCKKLISLLSLYSRTKGRAVQLAQYVSMYES